MDVNKDSFPDIVFVNSSNDFIACINNGNGQFPDTQIIYSESNGSAYPHLIPGDFDDDGDSDILYWDINTHDILILLRNDGQGQFYADAAQPVNLSAYGMQLVRQVDLDADGSLDLLIKGISTIYWLKNTGNGVFAAPDVLLTGFDNYFGASFADMDSDNDVDIVVTRLKTTDIFWFENLMVVGTHHPRFVNLAIDLAPNPATAESMLTLPFDGLECRIRLYTADGRLVQEHITADAKFRLGRNNSPAGKYVVLITDAANTKLLASGILIWR